MPARKRTMIYYLLKARIFVESYAIIKTMSRISYYTLQNMTVTIAEIGQNI